MYSQYASPFLASSYIPSWQMNQLTIVAAAAGSIKRNVRLKEDEARFVRALSVCPERASLIGLRALTKPERTRNMATQE